MAIYLVLAFCALGTAAMVYRYDMYDREPVFLSLQASAVSGWPETWKNISSTATLFRHR